MKFTIYDWMIHDLRDKDDNKITGNDLFVFAYLFEVKQNASISKQYVSLAEICDALDISRQSINRNIGYLYENDLITRRKQGKSYIYSVNKDIDTKHCIEESTVVNGKFAFASCTKRKLQDKPNLETYRENIRIFVNQYFGDIDGHEQLQENLIKWINGYQPKNRKYYDIEALNGELVEFMDFYDKDFDKMLEKSVELSRHCNYKLITPWEKKQTKTKSVENISDYGKRKRDYNGV